MNTSRLAGLALILAFGLAMAEDRTGWPKSFTVGAAYFAYGSGWANLVTDELGISGGGEVTGGPMQNMALVYTGETAFGMTTLGRRRNRSPASTPSRRACK